MTEGKAEAVRTVTLPQRGKRVRWTQELVGLFMDHLAETGNITASARFIDVDPSQVYYRQRTNAAFATAWRAAIQAGYLTVEARMIGHVLSGGDDGATASERGSFDWDQALRLLAQRESHANGTRKHGPQRKVATRQDTDAAILRQLSRLARNSARTTSRRAPEAEPS